MKLPLIKTILRGEPGSSLRVQGWIKTKRESKKLLFIALNDGSCLKDLQLILPRNAEQEADYKLLQTGAALRASGRLKPSPGKNQDLEFHVDDFEILGTCDEDFPLQKKRHSFEFLREIPHLRVRTNTIAAVTRVRNKLSRAIHQFFQDRDFFQIHTPIITSSDCEGGGDLFSVEHHSPGSSSSSPNPEKKEENSFFGKPTYLTVSGQLAAEGYAVGLGRVYTFGPTFRAENSNTARHLSEFWMVEPEMAFFDLDDTMELAEDFLKTIIRSLLEDLPDEMEFFDRRIEPGLLRSLEGILEQSFCRLPYAEAVRLLEKADKKFEFPVFPGMDPAAEHERYLTEELIKKPVMLTDYPKEIKAFYMKKNPDGKTVRCLDVLVPRLGEIIGGSQREDHYETLKKRIVELNHRPEDYNWYLDLRRFGGVPHSGFGLGFERLIRYVTGMSNIRDVIPYPRSPKNCIF